MQKTDIEWTDLSWNPIGMKCTPVSPGCANCWHLDVIRRFGLKNEGLREKELEAPLKRKKPSKIAVQLMGDLFHESVPFEWVDKVIAVLTLCSQHTGQLLTKRIERAFDYWTKHFSIENIASIAAQKVEDGDYHYDRIIDDYKRAGNVVPNIWQGATIENQKMADQRIPILLEIEAAVRYVSIEPMLSKVDLSGYMGRQYGICGEVYPYSYLDWVIVGCESGHNRRICPLHWIAGVADQCNAAKVPCFVKQIGQAGKLIKSPPGWPQEFPKGVAV